MKKIRLLLLLGIAFCVSNLLNAQSCNCAWPYKVPITITNSGATALTNYQVSVTVNTSALVTANKMISTGDDIRFSDAACTNLPYWIESGMNTASTVIWINVNNISPNATTTIYMYYGNPLATAASNGNTTFMLFDDFTGASLDITKWTPHTSGTGTVTVSGGTVIFNAPSEEADIVSKASFAFPYISEIKVNAASGNWPNLVQLNAGSFDNGAGLFSGGATMYVGRTISDCSAYGGMYFNSFPAGTLVGQWSVVRTSTGATVKWPGGTVTSGSFPVPTAKQLSGFGLLCQGTGNSQVDWFRARQYYATGTTQSVGAETPNSCVAGAALNFDGVDDKVVVTNSSVNLANSSFSIEMWLKRGAEGTDDFVFSQGGNIGNDQTLHIGFRDNGDFTFAFYGDDLNVPGYSDLLWHQWACTFDNTTKVQTVYRDGVLVGQRTATSSFLGSGNSNLVIGVAAYGSQIPNFYNGDVDEVRVWNTVRTSEQVNQLRNCELTGAECGLLAYYKFNQGNAGANNTGVTTLTDATANGNNGTLNNFALTGATSNWVAPGGVTSGVSCSPVTAPEINVQGNGNTIDDGDGTPSASDHTDFGNVNTGSNLQRTFTIQNTGTANLTVSGITMSGTNAAMFIVGALTPASPVTPGNSATFTVTFTPTSTGPKTATVNIASNDCDESTYDYAVQGTGTTPASNNANLSNLVLSEGTLTPSFASGTTTYSASVPNSTTSITVTPTAADPNATITVNGTPVTSGTASGPIALATGNNVITTVVTAQDGTTTKTYTVNVNRACPSDVDHQAYVANTTAGNQPWRGELGMEFTVNNASGIVIKQLGAFDDGGNGITGLQNGGVRVAVFNRSTHNIVPGLNIVITGTADHYTGNHRMVDIAPVTLPRGDYVIVAKGYYAGERDGSGSFPPGDDGSGAITFGTEVSYGPDDPNGFNYPVTVYSGSSHAWNAGTFVFTSVIPCGGGPSNNANLSNLVLSQGTLAPSFAQNTTSYTASVPNSTTSITVTPTTADAGATVTVNGTPVSSGSPSNPVPLAVGSNIINVVVTAADGTTTKTYTVNVTRAVAGPSTNANLSSLVLSQGTLNPPFAQNTTSYTTTVPNSTTSIMITPTAAEAGASITVNGTPVASGSPSGPIALAVGTNPAAAIEVTAPDGVTKKTYTVTITRQAAGSGCESPAHQAYTASTQTGNHTWQGELGMQFIVNNASGIIIKQLGAFDDGGNGITGLQSGGVRVAIFNRSTMTIVAGLNVVVAGTADHYTGNHRFVDITPVTLPPGDYVIVAKGYHAGERDGAGSFPAGDNGGGAITFGNEVSYGPDNASGFAYPVTAYSGDAHAWLAGSFIFTTPTPCGGASNNASLSNLVLSQGTLTPAFNSNTTSYTASVPNGTTSITVTPTAQDAGATITVNGSPVASGTPSNPIALAVGSNTINVVVTAQDGTTTKTYTVTVTRAGAGPSNNANLSNLILSQGTLTPSFAQNTTSYTASVPNGTTSITVTPTKADAGATITVNGSPVASGTPSNPIALAVGSNIINVVVTAQDGTTTKTYTINVTRAAAGGGGCESAPAQAYTASTTFGNQPWQGELGMEFIVNNPGGIIIKQLGAFDEGGNGITGLQSGGVRVAIFNRNTMAMVPGLNVVITGLADHYTGNHRMVDITPVTLPPGDYVIVAKGYHDGEKAGSGSFPVGDNGGGAITFGSEVSYGPNNPSGFAYPVTAYSGDPHAWLAGTFVFTVPVACFTATETNAGAGMETIETTALRVSPNPASGEFKVQLIDYGVKKVTIQIMDQNGIIVDQRTIGLAGKTPVTNVSFNLARRPAGMYFIRVSDGNNVRTQKVIIQH